MNRPTVYDRDGYPRPWAVLAGTAGVLATPYALMWVSIQLARLFGTI